MAGALRIHHEHGDLASLKIFERAGVVIQGARLWKRVQDALAVGAELIGNQEVFTVGFLFDRFQRFDFLVMHGGPVAVFVKNDGPARQLQAFQRFGARVECFQGVVLHPSEQLFLHFFVLLARAGWQIDHDVPLDGRFDVKPVFCINRDAGLRQQPLHLGLRVRHRLDLRVAIAARHGAKPAVGVGGEAVAETLPAIHEKLLPPAIDDAVRRGAASHVHPAAHLCVCNFRNRLGAARPLAGDKFLSEFAFLNADAQAF